MIWKSVRIHNLRITFLRISQNCFLTLTIVPLIPISELRITQPSFTSSVGGYSSYLAFPVDPVAVVKHLDIQFHFTAEATDQVALLFFLGQEGFHEYGSDYIAVSYVKGHILLTWDLGAGPRRIFTKRPVDERYLVHSVQFGRYGRLGYLQVDNFPNITGRAPGLRENLNITSRVRRMTFDFVLDL